MSVDVSQSPAIAQRRRAVFQLPEDLRFPLYRERNRKDPTKPRKTQPLKLHDIGDNRETRRKLGVKS